MDSVCIVSGSQCALNVKLATCHICNAVLTVFEVALLAMLQSKFPFV
jgi:hypothetical protein